MRKSPIKITIYVFRTSRWENLFSANASGLKVQRHTRGEAIRELKRQIRDCQPETEAGS